jgi:predicted dehydrogenase
MVRVAIVGAGLMGRWHVSAARRAGATVTAVVDRDIAAAQRLARAAPGAAAGTDLAPLLAEGRLDAVHLCTPASTHLELATPVLAAGVHALIEKPLGVDAAEVEQLLALAAERGVQVCPVHQYAFQDGMGAALARLPAMGALHRVDFNICSAGAAGAFAGRPDAVIGEILPHPLSMLQRLIAAPRLDHAAWTVLHPAAGELLATARLGETIASLYISMNARPTGFGVRLQCSGGALELDGFHGFMTRQGAGTSRSAKLTGPFERSLGGLGAAAANLAARAARWEPAYPGLRPLVEAFYAAVSRSAPPPISAADILAGAKARDAILAQLHAAPPPPPHG